LQLTSVTMTDPAPAARHIRTMAATTSGFVVAACSGSRSQAMFGLTTTRLAARDEPRHAAEVRDGPLDERGGAGGLALGHRQLRQVRPRPHR